VKRRIGEKVKRRWEEAVKRGWEEVVKRGIGECIIAVSPILPLSGSLSNRYLFSFSAGVYFAC
jgi:hypothetical protein